MTAPTTRVPGWMAPLALFGLALLVRLVTMAWVPFPPTEGSLYYLDVARHLVAGEGLTTNVLWSYATPPMAVPRPAFDLWLPLASLIEAIPMLVAGPTHQAGQLGMAVLGAAIAPLAWAVAREAGTLDGLGARRTAAAAAAAGLLAAILGPWLIATVGPDSTVPFAVLGTLDALLIARLLRPGGSRAVEGLVLGGTLGLTYLARQEVVWIGMTLLVLAVPVIARGAPGARLGAALRLLGPVVAGGLVVVVPWLVRQQLTFGGASAGQLVDNMLLVRNQQIFAIHDTPTLASWLGQGVAGIAGNIARAVATQLTETLVLGAFPVGLAGLASVVGLRRRPSLRTPSALAVLLLSGALTFVATALLFPVATLWGTFQHASGPLLVGLIVAAVLGMDALMTRISVAREWHPVNVIVGPAALLALALPVALIQLSSVRGSATDMERRIAAVRMALEASGREADGDAWIGTALDPGEPLVSDHPMALAWVLDRPVLVLPDDPPSVLGELARTTGARQLVILDERGRYPDVLLHPVGEACLDGPPFRVGLAEVTRVAVPAGPGLLASMTELEGTPAVSPYTRATMGSVTRDDQRTAVDGLYAEAISALDRAADDLRGLTGRLREAVATASPLAETDADPSRTLDAATRLERLALTLDQARWWLAEPPDASADLGTEATDDETGRLLLTAQEEERARLAEELHDGPTQVLSNAVLRVRIVERAMRANSAVAATELDGLRLDLERETERLRDYIRQLRPTLIEPGDLASEIDETAAQLRKDAGITVEVELAAPESELDAQTRTAVLRVTLEALRNVRKHAHARRVRVLSWMEPPEAPNQPGWWILEVQDDGDGFVVEDAPEHAGRRHFGLRFMRERAQHVGGELEIVSEAAAGTTVRLRLHPRERSRTTW